MKAPRYIITAALAGMMAVPAYAQIEVTWWDFFVGGDGVRMRSLIDRFNSDQNEIRIVPTTLEWGVPYYTKIRTASAVGQGPDMMAYHVSRLPLARQEGVLTEITDRDLQVAELSREELIPAAVEAATEDDALWIVPFDIHALVLFYNKDILEGSEYLDEDGKLTGVDGLENFEGALAYAADQGARAPISYGTAYPGSTYRVFSSLVAQQGGELVTDGEVLAGDNADKAARAIEIMTNWNDSGWQPEQAAYEASVALFTSGQSAFFINGAWEVPTLKDLDAQGQLGFEWGVTTVPVLLDQPGSFADSHGFAIPPQGNQDVDPEKREAVMKVIGWMMRNSFDWAEAGHIPTYLEVIESEAFAELEPNSDYVGVTDQAVFDPRSIVAGVGSPFYDAATNIISPAIHGYLSPEDAVEQIRSNLQPMIR